MEFASANHKVNYKMKKWSEGAEGFLVLASQTPKSDISIMKDDDYN